MVWQALVSNPGLLFAATFLLGLLVGSFLNVVILRLPKRLMHGWRQEAKEILELQADEAAPPDLVMTASHCAACKRPLSWWENIPLVSFIFLRGKCRSCKTAISWQYPLVEFVTGIVSLLVVMRFGLTPQTAILLLYSWVLIAASVIDLHTQLLPDQLTLPLLWLGLLASVASWFVPAHTAILGAAIGYLSLWSVYWAFKLLTGKEGMGYGDFKLLAALGALTGWEGLLAIILISSMVGAVMGGMWLAVQGRDKATPIPFGPFLAIAGWLQLVYGAAINPWLMKAFSLS